MKKLSILSCFSTAGTIQSKNVLPFLISYDAILSCYHDQGLCPIKALAFDKAINTTIGLDIIRTSPSSGTAYDIAGKNIANPDSMIEAVRLALKLS